MATGLCAAISSEALHCGFGWRRMDQQQLHGLMALDAYIRENPDTVTWNDISNYLSGIIKLIKDNNGDVGSFIDMVCSSFREHMNAPESVVEGLRLELEDVVENG